MTDQTDSWIALDKAHIWHPFTQQQDWCAPEHDPLVIVRGDGVWLEDSTGKRYIDGNSSIWTNIHGHNHPTINRAITDQLSQIAHTSFLGATHPLACELAEKLVSFFPDSSLERVFYSDDGSTALECAFKMALQYRELIHEPQRDTFVVFENAYHGDTLGAASLGGVTRFASAARKQGFKSCVIGSLEDLRSLGEDELATIAAVVIEPLVQGVNEMHMWPRGMLGELRNFCDAHDLHLILDEIMTGFGRTGEMFACHSEQVVPDFLCLAKGLTGGYSPLAATLVTDEIYSAFLGSADRTFYYGHSYTAHPLGCAAALANLDLFDREDTLSNVTARSLELAEILRRLAAQHPSITATRQTGLIAGISLDRSLRSAADVVTRARDHGLLTRHILDTIVIMPPLSISAAELALIGTALDRALHEPPA